MPKIIKYKYIAAEINLGTEENPNIKQIIHPMEFVCHTKAQFDANYTIAEKEAIPGTLDPDPDGEFEEPELTDKERIVELEEALELFLSGAVE